MTQNEFINNVISSQKALRRFLLALCCGNHHLADDIAQESLMKAWISIDSFRGDASFATWIRRIAYNTFINFKRGDIFSNVLPDTVLSTSISDAKADESFEYQELYGALEKLTPKERTSILLYYLEGYSVKEIADLEETSTDAVKQHLSRGRTHLRKILS